MRVPMIRNYKIAHIALLIWNALILCEISMLLYNYKTITISHIWTFESTFLTFKTIDNYVMQLMTFMGVRNLKIPFTQAKLILINWQAIVSYFCGGIFKKMSSEK